MKKIVMLSGMMLMVFLLASCNLEKSSETTGAVSTSQSETTVATDESMEKTMDEPIILAQGFAEYDDSLVGESKNTVLFFHQESCATCKATEKSLIEEGVPTDLQVLKIDIDADSSVELKKKYGVTMKHTFVQIDANGELLKKWNGSMNADDIIEQIGEDRMMDGDYESEWTDEEMKEMEMMDGEHEGDRMMKDDDMIDKGDESMEKEEVMTKELAGTYTDYDSNMLGKSENTVIFFHANWCPSCRAADVGISGGTLPEGLTILKADFDSETDLRKKYGVVGQHTFVQVDADGNEIKKWLGGNDVESIVERLQ